MIGPDIHDLKRQIGIYTDMSAEDYTIFKNLSHPVKVAITTMEYFADLHQKEILDVSEVENASK